MAVNYNQSFSNCNTALDILTQFPNTFGKDGYYMVYPNGRSSIGQLVYCDMTTDGGGWMLIARSHPTGTPTTWGWQGNKEGGVQDFSKPYQAGWWQFWNSNSTFTSFIYGNRLNVNNNFWGPFIYKRTGLNYTTFTTSDTLQTATNSVLKSDVGVFNNTAFPGMQSAIGFPITGTNNKTYYMRDCCGFGAYGGYQNGFVTTYTNHASLWYYSGPWGAGNTYDGSGVFVQNTGSVNYGGTNQYMIMVR